ncbi:MAG TPA: hypothetical protein VMT45_08770 [Thermoanaerobaculaceae bacterium]|nr:hypothetical protein [Thermoanaerobaculaceae bacterium]
MPDGVNVAESEGSTISGEARRGVFLEALVLALLFSAYLGMVRHFSSDVPGGSDWWGYVSEAVRLSHGRLYERENVLSRFGLPEDSGLTFPLAYVPKGPEGTVPTYPFGYPLLMAVAIRIAGMQAAFWVTPILAAGAVLLTYWLGRALLGRAGGAIAALFLGVLANFFLGAFQPWSDVPATFFVALVLVALLAMHPGVGADVLLGAALGFGVWVRPNLGLVIGVVGVWLIARREWRRLVRVALAVAPFLLIEALVNWNLFGAPWKTGYGHLAFGGPLADSLGRGGRHLLRLNLQQAGVGLALFALALLWNRLVVAQRLLLAGVFVALLLLFAGYRWDNAWWYFRFLLPAMPAVVVLEAGLLVRLADPGRWRRLRLAAATVATCAVAFGSLRYAYTKGVFIAKEGEQHYPQAAAFVEREAHQPALVLAMQHSGSLRYYTKLAIARYDLGSPEWLTETLVKVARAGGNVYLAGDAWEIQRIVNGGRGFLLAGAERHGGPGDLSLFRLNPDRIAERLRRGSEGHGASAGGAVFSGAWTRGVDAWSLHGVGTIDLPVGADPALARLCAGQEPLPLRRRGLPETTVAPGRCADVPLLPGRSGRLSVAPLGEKAVTLPPVLLLPTSALRFQDQLSTVYMVPQVAHVAGQGGTFWQTDVFLVNPQKQPLPVTGLFLPTGQDNRGAFVATGALAPGAVTSLRDVLGLREFAWVGRLGAMLVVAGAPGAPCTAEECRFLLYSRTFNVVAPQDSPDADEWLPGLPFEAGMAGGRASFPNVTGGRSARLSVGMASWTPEPVRVLVRSQPGDSGEQVREEMVPAFGHLQIRMGPWSQGGKVEVEIVGAPPGVRLFAYVSVVDGETGAVCHQLPDRVTLGDAGELPPMPRVLSSGFRRDL